MAALKCWHRAEKLAMKELGGITKEQYPCTCKNGKTTLTCSTFGSSKPPEVIEITCVHCDGTGFVSHDGYVARFIYCNCHHGGGDNSDDDFDTFHAKDGRSVFGNDTYLCGECGMVVQFG